MIINFRRGVYDFFNLLIQQLQSTSLEIATSAAKKTWMQDRSSASKLPLTPQVSGVFQQQHARKFHEFTKEDAKNYLMAGPFCDFEKSSGYAFCLLTET